jgi:hypothetical protein
LQGGGFVCCHTKLETYHASAGIAVCRLQRLLLQGQHTCCPAVLPGLGGSSTASSD